MAVTPALLNIIGRAQPSRSMQNRQNNINTIMAVPWDHKSTDYIKLIR